MRFELKRIQIVGTNYDSIFYDKVGDIYWAIRDNKDEGGTQPYGIITEPTDALLVKETIDKAHKRLGTKTLEELESVLKSNNIPYTIHQG